MKRPKHDNLVKSRKTVTPAEAGVHNLLECLDSRFRGNDRKGTKQTFYESINLYGFTVYKPYLAPTPHTLYPVPSAVRLIPS